MRLGKEGGLFTKAIVRRPGANFADGLTPGHLGRPDLAKALAQHERYCEALEHCGLTLTRLEPDPAFPDSTFVEDTAVLTTNQAVLTRPGAASREGEVAAMADVVRRFFGKVRTIQSPGTLDGGDICQAGDRCFIGISHRTSEDGALQLASFLAEEGISSTLVDIRGVPGVLHLKSGMAYLDPGRMAVIEEYKGFTEFEGWEILVVPRGEEYAANCVVVNGHILLADGYAGMSRALTALGYPLLTLDMSEFRKMDGGLSCLSLRF
jgi:dimethylargininase